MSQQFSGPKKSLGQNFLQDQNIIRKIIASLGDCANTLVLEIGPGRGALTDHLMSITQDLHIVEFDHDLAEYWQAKSQERSNLTVHSIDILKLDLAKIVDTVEAKIKVIGNLPYNISSPVLFHLMPFAEHFDSQIVMLQKEVVDRMTSSSGSKQYGRLSVMLQYRYQIEQLFTVPSNAFFPPPKVNSAIARLTPRPSSELSVLCFDDFSQLVKQAFSQRRKTLRNTLKQLLPANLIEECGIDASDRAESLNVNEFVLLANAFTESKNN